MELRVISAPEHIAGEAAIINALFEAGMNCFHLRKPGWDQAQVSALLIQLDPLCYPHIVLHQHHELAADFGIAGLHYTEQHRTDTDSAQWQRQRERGYRLSTSIHDIASLSSLVCFDAVLFGPVFDSLSKPGYRGLPEETFRIGEKDTTTRVIAIGGVSLSNLHQVVAMEFDGAAVLGALWQEPHKAVANFSLLAQLLLQHKIAT